MESFHGDLAGVVAVVTGASRGAGRAVATVLGAADAQPSMSPGRSVRGAPSGLVREGTPEETAEAVEERGGPPCPFAATRRTPTRSSRFPRAFAVSRAGSICL